MANLIPVSSFDDVVALEKGNPIIGARLGMSNRQAQQLLNRYTYLKDSLDYDTDYLNQYLIDNYDRVVTRNNTLSREIDTLNNKSDVVDVIATYSDLQNYDTSSLYDNDIVKVLNDSTQHGRCSYYRWSTSTEQFSLAGVEKSNVPVIVDEDIMDDPIVNVTYVVYNGVVLTISSGQNAYAGLKISIVAKGNCTLNINGNDVTLVSNTMLQYIYDGTVWIIERPSMLNSIYPVGHIYISVNDTSPATFLGGVWQKLAEGNAIITAGSTFIVGNTYGNSSRSVTPTATIGSTSLGVTQIPSHVHTTGVASGNVSADHVHSISDNIKGNGIVVSSSKEGYYQCAYSTTTYPASSYSDAHTHSVTVSFSANGSGTAHNHGFTGTAISYNVMQEYTAVNMWIRTA